jgi:plastocyanin
VHARSPGPAPLPPSPEVTVRRSLAPAALLVALTACGGGGSSTEIATEPVAAEDGTVTIVGTDRLRWSADRITTEPGELTIELVCEDAVNHNLVIDGEEVAVCTPGNRGTATVTLEPGEHEFVCTVPGHQRSMRGTITAG